jgi:hypothetical protein
MMKSSVAGSLAATVNPDFDVLGGDQPVSDHFIENRHDLLDLLNRVNAFDEKWQVCRHAEEVGSVQQARFAEAFDAT